MVAFVTARSRQKCGEFWKFGVRSEEPGRRSVFSWIWNIIEWWVDFLTGSWRVGTWMMLLKLRRTRDGRSPAICASLFGDVLITNTLNVHKTLYNTWVCPKMGTHKKSSGWSSSPSYEYSPFLDTPTCENGSIQKPSLTKNHSDSLSTWVLSRLSATWRMRYATFLASGTGRFLKKQSEKLELEYYWSSSTARSAETFRGWERDPQSENGTGKIDEIWCNRNQSFAPRRAQCCGFPFWWECNDQLSSCLHSVAASNIKCSCRPAFINMPGATLCQTLQGGVP